MRAPPVLPSHVKPTTSPPRSTRKRRFLETSVGFAGSGLARVGWTGGRAFLAAGFGVGAGAGAGVPLVPAVAAVSAAGARTVVLVSLIGCSFAPLLPLFPATPRP